MKSRLTYFLISLALRLNGWRPCRNCEGCPAWTKMVNSISKDGTVILKGDWKYAVQQIQR